LLISIAKISDIWVDSVRVANGRRGWYRILGDSQKIGIVATANGLESLYRGSRRVPYEPELWASLESLSNSSQYWTFISTINDVGVVDATASVLVAIGECERRGLAPSPSLGQIRESALNWLEQVSREDGGWGLIAGAPMRSYSTALALRALALNGRVSSSVFDAAVDALLNTQNADSGAWTDEEGRASVPLTAECLRTLALVSTPIRPLNAAISSAAAFLLDDGARTALWSSEKSPGQFEEVAVSVAGSHRRIEHTHTSRAVSVIALVSSGYGKKPLVTKAVAQMVEDANSNRWSAYARGRYSKPPSWMLYDVLTALSVYKDALLGNEDEVWVGRRRFIAHPVGRQWIARRLIEQYPKLLLLATVVALYAVLNTLQVFEQPWVSATIAIVVSIVVNLVSSFAYSVITKNR
jgi:hypothetical protein